MGYRNYSTAVSHIVDPSGLGDFTTISAALTAAVSGQTIFVRPGTYIENPTLKAGVDICAFVTDSDVPNVIIKGKCTFTGAGTVGLSGIELQTNSDFCLAVTGSAASVVYLNDCYINCLNNTGISFTSSSASATINITDCSGNVATTGIGVFASSSAGGIRFLSCLFFNTGNSTTANTFSAGGLNLQYTGFNNPLSVSGTAAFTFNWSTVACQAINTTAFALTSSSAGAAYSCQFVSGTATAITIGSTSSLTVDFLSIGSTNTVAISGAGIIIYGTINYQSNTTNTATTQTHAQNQNGSWSLISTLVASASATLEFKSLPVFNVYAFVFNVVKPATNAQGLQVVVSSNNGSTYANSGYNTGINYASYNSTTYTNVNATTFGVLTSNTTNGGGLSGTIFCDTGNGNYYGTMSYYSTDNSLDVLGTCGGGTGLVFNAFKFLFASGNITSGSISCYGINT